jgi:hypothetical protein
MKTSEIAIDEALKTRQTTTQLSVDLGTTFDFSRFFEKNIMFQPKFALVVKNINSPSFTGLKNRWTLPII